MTDLLKANSKSLFIAGIVSAVGFFGTFSGVAIGTGVGVYVFGRQVGAFEQRMETVMERQQDMETRLRAREETDSEIATLSAHVAGLRDEIRSLKNRLGEVR